MSNGLSHDENFFDDNLTEAIDAVADRIYCSHLPPYLQDSWSSGRGKWYEDWLREQLEILVLSEICDDTERLAGLEAIEDWVALVFGIFGAAFRILDHIGMHLRGQTFGQYDLLPEDVAMLDDLCKRFLEREPLELTPFSWVFEDNYEQERKR